MNAEKMKKLSVKIVVADYYVCKPVSELYDSCYSAFRSSVIFSVPIIRIFGPTTDGIKTCMHVHGVFPYIFVTNWKNEVNEKNLYNLATSLDTAINHTFGNASSKTIHVHRITIVLGCPFYGFYKDEKPFLKIEFYNPGIVRKAVDLLQNGAVFNTKFQPYEAHIPYILQFFIDYNLYGMSDLRISSYKMRNSHDVVDGNNELLDVCKKTYCELEIDVVAANILNPVNVNDNSLSSNPGLAFIWQDEINRRRHYEKSSQFTPNTSQIREDRPLTKSELFFKNQFFEKLFAFENKIYGQEIEPNSSDTIVEVPDHQINDSIDISSQELNTQGRGIVSALEELLLYKNQENVDSSSCDSSITLVNSDDELREAVEKLKFDCSQSGLQLYAENDSILGNNFSDEENDVDENDHISLSQSFVSIFEDPTDTEDDVFPTTISQLDGANDESPDDIFREHKPRKTKTKRKMLQDFVNKQGTSSTNQVSRTYGLRSRSKSERDSSKEQSKSRKTENEVSSPKSVFPQLDICKKISPRCANRFTSIVSPEALFVKTVGESSSNITVKPAAKINAVKLAAELARNKEVFNAESVSPSSSLAASPRSRFQRRSSRRIFPQLGIDIKKSPKIGTSNVVNSDDSNDGLSSRIDPLASPTCKNIRYLSDGQNSLHVRRKIIKDDIIYDDADKPILKNEADNTEIIKNKKNSFNQKLFDDKHDSCFENSEKLNTEIESQMINLYCSVDTHSSVSNDIDTGKNTTDVDPLVGRISKSNDSAEIKQPIANSNEDVGSQISLGLQNVVSFSFQQSLMLNKDVKNTEFNEVNAAPQLGEAFKATNVDSETKRSIVDNSTQIGSQISFCLPDTVTVPDPFQQYSSASNCLQSTDLNDAVFNKFVFDSTKGISEPIDVGVESKQSIANSMSEIGSQISLCLSDTVPFSQHSSSSESDNLGVEDFIEVVKKSSEGPETVGISAKSDESIANSMVEIGSQMISFGLPDTVPFVSQNPSEPTDIDAAAKQPVDNNLAETDSISLPDTVTIQPSPNFNNSLWDRSSVEDDRGILSFYDSNPPSPSILGQSPVLYVDATPENNKYLSQTQYDRKSSTDSDMSANAEPVRKKRRLRKLSNTDSNSSQISRLSGLSSQDERENSILSPTAFNSQEIQHSTPREFRRKVSNEIIKRRMRSHTALTDIKEVEIEQNNIEEKIVTSQDSSKSNVTRDSTGFQIEGPSLENTGGFKMDLENLQDVKMKVPHLNITVISLELFSCTRNDLSADPEFDGITVLFHSIHHDVSGVIGLNTGLIVVKDEQNTELDFSRFRGEKQYVENEIQLFEAFISLLRNWDPDVLVGYEIEMSSWGYLIQRGRTLGMNIDLELSRLRNVIITKHVDELSNQEYNEFANDLRLVGRIVLNVWKLMRHEISLQSYTFENIMYHVLHQRLPKYSLKTLTDFWNDSAQRWIVINYYLLRTECNLKLLQQLDFIGRTSELARLFGIQFYEVLSRGSQFRVESMMLRIAKSRNYIPVSPSVKQRASMRAPESLPLIMEPESKFYRDPVIVLDFQSLYPSIIIAYNYCFSTCLGRVHNLFQEESFEFGCMSHTVPRKLLASLKNSVSFSPCGVAFVEKSERTGILPVMLEEILNTRLMVKKSMKENKENKILQRVLHARQLGLKLIANVTYGYTSANFSGRMPCIEVGDSVVSKGRETLERAIELVSKTPKWNAKVVYGDTDSLFILLPGRTKSEAFRIGAEIADAVTADNPKPVKLKFEKVYFPCILQAKKRYVGYMFENPDQEIPAYDAKGIETVRRDGCPAVSKILEKSLKLLFETCSIDLIKSYVQRQFSKLISGRISIQDLTFAREYRGMNNYRPGACVPALQIARDAIAKDSRSEPRIKERVRYLIIAGPPGVPLIRLVRTPEQFLQHPGWNMNFEYYITKAIVPALARCFSLLKVDVLSWYKDLPRKQQLLCLPIRADIRNRLQKKVTISHYFSSLKCITCERPVHSADICEDCASNTQRLALAFGNMINTWQRRYDYISTICKSCTEIRNSIECISLDCPVLYLRRQAEKDIEQSPYLEDIQHEYLIKE